jgi:ribosomal protein S27E
MTVSIDIRCDNCRGKNVSIPIYGGDETAVDCEDCGAELGTLADIKTLVSLQVLGRKTAARPRLMLVN